MCGHNHHGKLETSRQVEDYFCRSPLSDDHLSFDPFSLNQPSELRNVAFCLGPSGIAIPPAGEKRTRFAELSCAGIVGGRGDPQKEEARTKLTGHRHAMRDRLGRELGTIERDQD